MHTAIHIPTKTLVTAIHAHELFHEPGSGYQNREEYSCPSCGAPLTLVNAAQPLQAALKFRKAHFSARYQENGEHTLSCSELFPQVSHSDGPRAQAKPGRVIFNVDRKPTNSAYGKTSRNLALNGEKKPVPGRDKEQQYLSSQNSLSDLLERPNWRLDELRKLSNLWVREKGNETPLSDYVCPSSNLNYLRGSGLIYGRVSLEHKPEKRMILFRFMDSGNLGQPIRASYKYTIEDLNDSEFNDFINKLPIINEYDIALLWKGYKQLDRVLWLECDNTLVLLK